MKFRFDTVAWTLMRPALVTWGGRGCASATSSCAIEAAAALYANGLLPTRGQRRLPSRGRQFPLSNIVDIAQTDVRLNGLLTLHGNMTGTLSAPVFRGAFGVVNGSVQRDARARRARHDSTTADRQLVAHADALRKTGAIDHDGGCPPADQPRVHRRDRATGCCRGRWRWTSPATACPIELIPQIHRRGERRPRPRRGTVAMRGTLRRPSLTGALLLDHGTMTITSTGATVEDIGGSVRMARRHRLRRLARRLARRAGARSRIARRWRLARAGVQPVI